MQFCVTVCEFSVANSISGVRKMLPLVWSTDAAIKDAVVQAYRRLYLNPQGDTIRSVKLLHTYMTIGRALNITIKQVQRKVGYNTMPGNYFVLCTMLELLVNAML